MAATHIFDAPPEGVAADWTMPQSWAAFTAEQHDTWRGLFDRQAAALDGYACRSFLDGLEILRRLKPGVPDFAAVPGWIPNEPFFEHLANRRFPAANFVRPPEQIAYSEEPDMFHDIFGHVPMLADPAFSDFLVAYGQAGLRAEKLGASDFLGRLWLYTVEFGLVVEDGELRAFGGGLMSSLGEAMSALAAPEPRRIWLDIERVMRTRYHFDEFQQTYFVIAGFEALLCATEETDFAAIYRKIAGEPAIEPGDGWAGDLAYEGRLPAGPASGEARP